MLQLVWFKRDLRVRDHAPLLEAAQRGPVVPLFIVEPDYWSLPDVSGRHFAFLQRGIEDLDGALDKLGQRLIIRTGDAVEVLEKLCRELGVVTVWAHQETGNSWTYARDKRVRRWAREAGIGFLELPSNGIVRGLQGRDEWDHQWIERMRARQEPAPERLRPVEGLEPGRLPRPEQLALEPDPVRSLQIGGETAAQAQLETFLQTRAQDYRRASLSPAGSAMGSSRLSPYLAWGHLSVRQAFQAVRARLKGEPEDSPLRRNLESYEMRLRWRCHFVQKLESRPDLEFASLVPAYDLLARKMDQEKFAAWAEGRTGYPLVDAAMRALRTMGWLNFHLRAQLVSFATFDLWLPWQPVAIHLARLIVDYEPGIHYAQVQMHAGTGGSRSLRIYNPTKLARDHDPEGLFIRHWLPEMRAVPMGYLFEPWRMPLGIQRRAGCIIGQQYPGPICDHEARHRQAREAVAALRRSEETWEQSRAVWREIGSRHSAEPRRPKAPESAARLQQEAAGQMALFV